MKRGEIKNPWTIVVLTFISCGFYVLFWFYQACGELNQGLGRDEFDRPREFVFTVATCGLWSIWFTWRVCQATVELQRGWGVRPALDTPILFATFLVGLGPVFVQLGLNNAWENGAPGGARGLW